MPGSRTHELQNPNPRLAPRPITGSSRTARTPSSRTGLHVAGVNGRSRTLRLRLTRSRVRSWDGSVCGRNPIKQFDEVALHSNYSVHPWSAPHQTQSRTSLWRREQFREIFFRYRRYAMKFVSLAFAWLIEAYHAVKVTWRRRPAQTHQPLQSPARRVPVLVAHMPPAR